MEALHAIKQKEPHKRSKRGCLQCRKRRKKCPEDYQELSNGYWACSACETRGQKCKLPSRITSQQQRPQGSGTSSIIHDSTTSSHTPKSTQLVNNVSSFQRQSVSTEASDVEHSWLDTFLEEFMALTEPSLPTIAPATSPRSAFDLLSFAISQQSNTGNERNCSDQAIERMIRSDDLDDLLIKSAHVYDTFLCAIIDTSTMAGNASLIDHLMDITRSNNVCKASMVSCCLAYTDVIERERQNPRGPSRFVQYLLKGTKKANSSATASTTTIPSRQVSQWLKYATDGFHRSKSTMSLAAKLLTLLNLRFACICFLGAKDASALANDIHIVLSEVRIDMAYLRSTARKGTPLSVIIQALAFANIMEAASMKGVRAAISNETTEKAAALEVDLAINPRADLSMVTVLSIDLVECIKRISDLSADISEGHLHLPIDIEAKSEEIKMLILQSQVDMPKDVCQSNARVRSFLLQELWRQALLIQLYQDVLKLGPMAVRVQQALHSIIRLAKLLATTEEENVAYIDVWDMSFVWFLACTVSVSEDNRKFCLYQLENLGCERAILDNVEAIKVLWKSIDETGRSTEWRDVLSEHGIVINYTF